MKKCILFIRVSTEQQDLTQQRNKVVEEALRRGYSQDNHIIVEVKESGVLLDAEHRKGIQQMKNLILSDDSIDCVFIYELSRLSRRPADLYLIRDWLIEHHVNLISMTPSMVMLNDNGTLDSMAGVIFGIFGSLAEQEGYIRKERLRRGREIKKQSGCFTGGTKLFGYDTIKTKLGYKYVESEKDGRIVRDLFKRYVNENVSFRSLAKDLQELGYFTDVKYLTLVQKLNNLIRNKKYLGDEQHPQIISQELFDAANDKCTKNIINPKRSGKEKPALLKGLLYDKNNGYLLSCNHTTKCYYSKRFSGAAVTYKIIEPLIWDFVVKLHKAANDTTRNVQKIMRRKSDIYKKYKNAIHKQMLYQQQIDKIEERLILGRISDKKANELELAIQSSLKNERANEARFYHEYLALDPLLLDNKKEIKYDKLNLEEQIRIVNEVIRKITIARDTRATMKLAIETKYSNKITYLFVNSFTHDVYNITEQEFHTAKRNDA